MHVHALDRGAVLAGIRESPANDFLDGAVEVTIVCHVGRVVAAKKEVVTNEAPGDGRLETHGPHVRAGVDDVVNAHVAHDTLEQRVVAVELLHEVPRSVAVIECVDEILGDEARARRVLDDHRVARKQRRQQRTDEREKRRIPGRHHEHDTVRLADDLSRNAVSRLVLFGQRLSRQADERASAGNGFLGFDARLRDGLSHEARDVRGHRLLACLKRIHGALADGHSRVEVDHVKGLRRAASLIEKQRHVGPRSHGDFARHGTGEWVVDEQRLHPRNNRIQMAPEAKALRSASLDKPGFKPERPHQTKKSRGFLGPRDSWFPSGAEGDRTPDLMHAMHALSQLSYSPGCVRLVAREPYDVFRKSTARTVRFGRARKT